MAISRTKIEWCDYTWNPIVGCKHGCEYCYARRMNERFKFIPEWSEPKFFMDRLEDLERKISIPKKRNRIAKELSPFKPIIFVGSMCDMFGDWVQPEWIEKILYQAAKFKGDIEFMYLTKNPKRYLEFIPSFTSSTWLGETLTGETFKNMKHLWHVKNDFSHTGFKTFASIEPILSNFEWVALTQYDAIIVGAMTGVNAVKPKQEWIDSIKHRNIFFKDNILKRKDLTWT